MRPRIIVRAGIGSVALLALVLLWAFFYPSGQAGSVLEATEPPPPTVDSRWLALVRESQSRRLGAQQAAAPSINIHLTDGLVAGHATMAAMVVVSVTRAGSQVAYAAVTPLPDSSGFFYIAYLTQSGYPCVAGGGGCSLVIPQAGDVVQVTQAGTAVSMTVPSLSGLADAAADIVYGTAPISEPVTVYLFPFAAPEASYTQTVAADGAGNYQAAWPPQVDLRPKDTGYIAYAETPDRRAYARFVTPFLRAQVNGQEVSGLAAPRSTIAITVADTQGAPRVWISTCTDGNGFFQAWPGYSYYPSPLRPGDQIIAATAGQTFSMTVMTVTAHADLTNGQVWGEAPANLSVEVIRLSGPLQSSSDAFWDQMPLSQVAVTATVTGAFTASLPLARADYGAASVTSPDGHQTFARFAVPYLWVRLGAENVYEPPPGYFAWGQVDDLSAPITIAIQGPSGYLKDLRHRTAAGNGYFYDSLYYSEYLTLDSGDVITLTTPRGVQVALTLPLLTAQADPISNTVFGLAPPGSRLVIILNEWPQYPPLPPSPPYPTPTPTPPYSTGSAAVGGGGYYNQYTLVVTATALGEYRADFGALVDVTTWAFGQAQMTAAEGHTVARSFRAEPHCLPQLKYVQVGGNYVSGQSDYDCYGGILRLRDAGGQLKVEQPIPYWYRDFYLYLYTDGHPVSIMPGDTIEVGSGEQSVTTTVPLLTTQLDQAANTVTGQAPAGAVISLDLFRGGLLTPTVSANGAYSVSLAGQIVLEAGDRVRATCSPDGWLKFYAEDRLPLLQATLYESWLNGVLPPLTPYTISLVSPEFATAPTIGWTAADGTFYASLYSFVTPGQTVVVTTPHRTLQLVVPFLSANVGGATATVSGSAPPNARLDVALSDYYGGAFRSQAITATATGVYSTSFPDLSPLQNYYGTLIYYDENGYWVQLPFATPRWEVTVESYCVSGNCGIAADVPFTVTLRASDGTFTQTTGRAYWSGSFSACFGQLVQPGDQLTLTHPTGIMTFTVPSLTAEHDYARQVLKGQAAPGSAIAATLPMGPYYGNTATRHTLADADGYYGLDTNDLNLPLGRSGYVVMTDEIGNTIQRFFTIQGYRAFLPVVTRSP